MQRHDVASTLRRRCINVMCLWRASTLSRRCINAMCLLDDVASTLSRRCINVMCLLGRRLNVDVMTCIDVEPTLYKRHVPAGTFHWFRKVWANNVVPDETLQKTASDQGPHCSPFIQQFWDTSWGSNIDFTSVVQCSIQFLVLWDHWVHCGKLKQKHKRMTDEARLAETIWSGLENFDT